MKKIFFAFLYLSIVFASCAQSKCTVKKAYAFYTITIAGAAIADENGNIIPPTPIVSRFIYLECNGTKAPIVEKILYDNIPYSTSMIAVDSNNIVPGEYNIENVKHTIRHKKNNKLWKIEVQPADENIKGKEGVTEISISLKNADKTCIYKIKKETLLQTAPRY